MLCWAALVALDRRLARLTRAEGAWGLRLGQSLEALGHPDFCGSKGYAELGFSSLAAYARERVERSPRWAEAARCMARRLSRVDGYPGAWQSKLGGLPIRTMKPNGWRGRSG